MTGLIYVGIIAVWAVVLVPAWLRRHDHRDPEKSVDRFTQSLQALAERDTLLGIKLPPVDQSSSDPHPASAAPVSSARDSATDTTQVFRVRRGAAAQAQAQARRSTRPASSAPARRAAARRRVVLGVLVAGLVAVAGLVVGGILLPIALAVPAVLIAAFVATARHQVRSAQRARSSTSQRSTVSRATAARPATHATTTQSGATWEARPATLPTYVTAPPAAEFPRVIDTATPGAWTAAAMLERAQQQKARAERMAAARAEAIARAQAEQEAAEARSRDDEYLAQQSAAWNASHTTAPIYPARVVNE